MKGRSVITTKNVPKFPWGDGNHSLFYNPKVNAMPDGYEDEKQDKKETITEEEVNDKDRNSGDSEVEGKVGKKEAETQTEFEDDELKNEQEAGDNVDDYNVKNKFTGNEKEEDTVNEIVTTLESSISQKNGGAEEEDKEDE